MLDSERAEIIDICCEKRFVDLSPHEIVPILAEEGRYIASESTFYRVLRQEKMVMHRKSSKEPHPRGKAQPLEATGPNQVWSWDITYLKTEIKGMFYFLYLFMDIWSRKIVVWDIFEEQTSDKAKIVINSCKEKDNLKGVWLHSDNGSPMKGATFLGTLHKLGITPSFSRPSVSNDNAYSESLFKTIKYDESFPGHFESVIHAKTWVGGFVHWYNTQHRHSGINFVTPEQRHSGQDKQILEKRRQTYEEAKRKNPERFIQNKTRLWVWQKIVELNPAKKELKLAG